VSPIRILLVDDAALVRGGLRVLLEQEPDLLVIGEAGDGAEAIEVAQLERPDVILMDISMPRMDGVEATRSICADPGLEGTKVVMLTTSSSDEHVLEALRGGASGFLLKLADPTELVHAVRMVASGDGLVLPSSMREAIDQLFARRTNHGIRTEIGWLTDREREVLALVAAGMSNEQIAQDLVVSPATAKTHVSRAMRKLQAHDRAQLVVIAYETGLVSPGHVTNPAA
jgi:DNA-binding NarL/FixJ family response regulator